MLAHDNILTLDEALAAVKRDEDYGGELKSILPMIDSTIEIATGVKWRESQKIEPLAKAAARLYLQIEMGMRNTQLDKDRYTYLIKQLQAHAAVENGEY